MGEKEDFWGILLVNFEDGKQIFRYEDWIEYLGNGFSWSYWEVEWSKLGLNEKVIEIHLNFGFLELFARKKLVEWEYVEYFINREYCGKGELLYSLERLDIVKLS